MTIEFLRKVPLLASLPDADLEHLLAGSEDVRLRQGELLFDEGSPGDRLYIVREGRLRVIKQSAGHEVLLAVRQEGDLLGEMALIEEAPRMAAVRAECDSRLLAVTNGQLEQLLERSPAAARALLHTVVGRWRATEGLLRQSEKMAQLGTLSAGLAHELNNPAAAVQRAAAQLREAQGRLRAAEHAAGGDVAELEALVRERARVPAELDALARSDREAALEPWLEAHGVSDPWTLAPDLVSLGFDLPALELQAARFPGARLPAVLRWACAAHAVYGLLEELHQGASRIAELVKALKAYAYLNQAPVLAVNLHEGLDNTLVLLRGKLKEGVTVRREYAPDVPRIQAYGSELNQVWTNLIDNAVDAMNGRGELVIRTSNEGEAVAVEVIDSGSGIPPEVLPRIFNPFFSTKPPGKGTGLGLDISYNIVVHRHRGSIGVTSEPGRTCFTVRLPLSLEGPTASAPRATDEQLRALLSSARRIAVVGASRRPDLPAQTVPAYLKDKGYEIVPVHPSQEEILGVRAAPTLDAVTGPVDIVLMYRRSEEAPAVVDAAVRIGARAIWMPEGVVHDAAAATARRRGLEVVMDTCIRSAHRRLLGAGD